MAKKKEGIVEKKPIYKKWWFWLLALIVAFFVFIFAVGGSGSKHIYDDAEVLDVMNGFKTEKIGEMSVVRADESEVTEEVLADWYYNYVNQHDYNWNVIVYTDSNPTKGCYAIKGLINKDVLLDENDTYSLSSDAGSTTYVPNNDGKTLKKEYTMLTQEEQDRIKGEIEPLIDDSYKGDSYLIEVSSTTEDNRLAIDIELSNESLLEKETCNKVARELALKIKQLDLDIEELSIALGNNYKITGWFRIDDLSNTSQKDINAISIN